MAILHPRYGDYNFSQLDSLKVAWAAGFFDGEGCVSIQCKKRPKNSCSWFVLTVTISNTNLDSMDTLKSLFGFGTIYAIPKIEGRQQGYKWILTGRSAEIFLTAVRSYSIVKKPHVELALEFRGLGQKVPFKKVEESVYTRGCEIAAAIRNLNGNTYRKALVKIVPKDYVE